MSMSNFFSKEYITAKASYNRWLVPPAALAIHLSIGMAHGYRDWETEESAKQYVADWVKTL